MKLQIHHEGHEEHQEKPKSPHYFVFLRVLRGGFNGDFAMRARRFRMTAALRSQIIAGIHAGGYPHVAAAAFAVPREVFDDWLQRGQASDAKEPYRSFAREIADAQAKARLRAEMTLFETDPKSCLRHGPGRE